MVECPYFSVPLGDTILIFDRRYRKAPVTVTVTFGATRGTLHEGLPGPEGAFYIAEDTLGVARVSCKIKNFCTQYRGPVCSHLHRPALHVTDNGETAECSYLALS
jgi:hypothetical protein